MQITFQIKMTQKIFIIHRKITKQNIEIPLFTSLGLVSLALLHFYLFIFFVSVDDNQEQNKLHLFLC